MKIIEISHDDQAKDSRILFYLGSVEDANNAVALGHTGISSV